MDAWELFSALENLVNKLEEINKSEAYKAVWFMYMNHGMEYKGPNYGEELDAARKVLKEQMGE